MQKFKGQDLLFEEKKQNFQGFRVFDFTLYPKSETWKSQKVFFYFKF